MSLTLELIIEEIKELALQSNEEIVVDKTGDKMSFILANKKRGFVGVLASGPLIKGGNHIVNAYSIDVGKWVWAQEEGFSKDQMVTELKHQIFKSISFDELINKLINS